MANKNMTVGVVLYNPDMELLAQNLNAIIDRFENICLVDNGSTNISEIETFLKQYYTKNICVIANKENLGIARALNQICDYAARHGYKWCLTLDQDSVCPQNLYPEYEKYISNQIGMLCPNVSDRNRGDIIEISNQRETEDLKECITSGSLISLSAWKEINGFDEKLFIDGVDFDICYRLRHAGFRIVRVNNVVLSHEIGKLKIKKFLSWSISVQNHSSFRKYYMARNNIYLAKKKRNIALFVKAFLQNIKLAVIIVLYENMRKEKIAKVWKGTIDGLMM